MNYWKKVYITCHFTLTALMAQDLIPAPDLSFTLTDLNLWEESRNIISQWNMTAVTLGQVFSEGGSGTCSDNGLEVGDNDWYKKYPVNKSFKWNGYEYTVVSWKPQGITGTSDAFAEGILNGKKLMMVSWHHDPEEDYDKGVRISFLDVSDFNNIKFRHILIVEPYVSAGEEGRKNGVNYKPIRIHAGGIVWYKNYLYIVDTYDGFRVFDLNLIKLVGEPNVNNKVGIYEVNGSNKSYAALYNYILPQVNFYKQETLEEFCRSCYKEDLEEDTLFQMDFWSGMYGDPSTIHKFSCVAIDKTISPYRLVVGESWTKSQINNGETCRVTHFSLSPCSGKLIGSPTINSFQTYTMDKYGCQGVISLEGVYFHTHSTADQDELYREPIDNPNYTYQKKIVLNGIEDLYYDFHSKLLWTLTEFSPNRGGRFVFGYNYDFRCLSPNCIQPIIDLLLLD